MDTSLYDTWIKNTEVSPSEYGSLIYDRESMSSLWEKEHFNKSWQYNWKAMKKKIKLGPVMCHMLG